MAIVVAGERPVVRLKAKGQKARRDEVWPCPPEFAAMLEAVPEAERVGFVINPHKGETRVIARQGGPDCLRLW